MTYTNGQLYFSQTRKSGAAPIVKSMSYCRMNTRSLRVKYASDPTRFAVVEPIDPIDSSIDPIDS
jgi:hypothetical protein